MFSQLGLGPTACASLARLGYHRPTPIQTDAIPVVLRGVDVLARAQTGTGKTAAFGLPMIERLVAPPPGRVTPRALVLVPTRELAAQVHRALSAYAAPARLRIAAIFGGVPMNGQVQALRRGTDIIVATPGRLVDHMQRRTVDLSAIEMLTLDEADRMLDMGFLPVIRRVVGTLPSRRQTLLFSATLSEAIVRLSAEFTRAAVRIDVSGDQVVAAKVTHQVHHVALDRKRKVLTEILMRDGNSQALVFCRTKRGASRVGDDLQGLGINAGVIHGNKSQNARSRALADFKGGRLRVLVATDIASRGLDIADLPLVVNFDLPLVAEDYVHRVGRTGRAGRPGRAVSLVSASEATLLRDIQRLVAVPLERVATLAADAVVERQTTEQRRPMPMRARAGQPPVVTDRTRAFRGRRAEVARPGFAARRARSAGRADGRNPRLAK
jgi:ATP-dependent RNA helicase RhlE